MATTQADDRPAGAPAAKPFEWEALLSQGRLQTSLVRRAVRITLFYAVFAAIWIYLSDEVARRLADDMHEVVELNKAFFPWIRERHAEGAEVASLCVGAFLLAGTGLLEGKRCSTHWSADHLFRTMYPGVTLVPDKVITDEEGVYSSGGANSFWNLLLYLVEKYVDRAMAVHIAKYYEIEIDRVSQASYFMFKGQKEHDDAPVRKVQEYIETNYQERLTVADLASMAALSRRNLERRFKKATSNTVVEYIQRVKVEAAKLRLESSGENVNEVMERVGYADSKAFRTTFRKITGLSPLEYRAKYRRPESYGVSM